MLLNQHNLISYIEQRLTQLNATITSSGPHDVIVSFRFR